MMIETKTASKKKCKGIEKIKHKDISYSDSEDNVFDLKEWKKNFASSECGAKIVRQVHSWTGQNGLDIQ